MALVVGATINRADAQGRRGRNSLACSSSARAISIRLLQGSTIPGYVSSAKIAAVFCLRTSPLPRLATSSPTTVRVPEQMSVCRAARRGGRHRHSRDQRGFEHAQETSNCRLPPHGSIGSTNGSTTKIKLVQLARALCASPPLPRLLQDALSSRLTGRAQQRSSGAVPVNASDATRERQPHSH